MNNVNSIIIKTIFIFWLTFLPSLPAAIDENQDPSNGCTIGVASGRATSDGRPLLWKTRDGQEINNEVYFNTYLPIKYIAVVSDGQTANSWMGVNECGFAILNSAAFDLPAGSSGLGNGMLMSYALGTCRTVSEFQHFLDSTNVTGRATQANFGVVDSTGAAAMFETSGNHYWKFDANDSIQVPNGYVLRTNFSVHGGGNQGIERYRRSCDLIFAFHSGDSLNYRSILRRQMRDFSDHSSHPYQVPYPCQISPGVPVGYIDTEYSICNTYTISTAVIRGVLPAEKAILSTLWICLGQPAAAIAVPYWPVGVPPPPANGPSTAPLCDTAILIRSCLFNWPANTGYINTYRLRDGQGSGLWTHTFPAEDSLMTATDSILNNWQNVTPAIPDIMTFEEQCANYALEKLQQAYNILVSIEVPINELVPEETVLSQNYPNPFNASTNIEFRIPKSEFVTLKIYNLVGEEVCTLLSASLLSGFHSFEFDASDLASGVYVYQLLAGSFVETRKMILLR